MKRKPDWSMERHGKKELRESMRCRRELEVGCSMAEWRKESLEKDK